MNNPASPEYLHKTYTINQPNIEDVLELVTMHNQSWIDTYPNDDAGVSLEYINETIASRLTEESLNRRKDNIERSKNDPRYFSRVAKNELGHIVGFINGYYEADKYELEALYIDKTAHGTGLAMQLWESYKEWTDPTKTMWLTVVTYNERAKAFYRKIGFKEMPETERFFKDTHIPIVDMDRAPEEYSL